MKIIILSLLILAVICGLFFYYSTGGANIIIITAPNNYKGLININGNRNAFRKSKGVEYNIKINKDGYGLIDNLQAYYEWHNIKVKYENGENIQYIELDRVSFEEDNLNNTDIKCFQSNVFINGKGFYYYIGTESEFKKFIKPYLTYYK